MPVGPQSPRVLLVEGQDDEHVVDHLRRIDSSIPDFSIVAKGGISALLRSIEAEVKAPDRETLGILVDANDDLRDRWNAVSDRLRKSDIHAPTDPDTAGTVIECTPRIGIWLMPANQASGELENFIAGMIPNEDAVWPMSQAYVDGIPERDRRFSDRKLLRTKVHSWLATRAEPRRMGAAIGAGDLVVDAPGAVRLVEWLRRLFG